MDGGNHLQLMALRPINDRWGSRLGSSRERSPLGSGRAQGLAVGLSRGQVGQGFDRSRDIVQRRLGIDADGQNRARMPGQGLARF